MTTNAIQQPPEMLGIGTRSYSVGAAAIASATVPGPQSVAIGAATAPTTFPVLAVEVCITATVACFIVNGASPVASATTGLYLPANLPFHIRTNSTDKIAVIQASTGGTLFVCPVLS